MSKDYKLSYEERWKDARTLEETIYRLVREKKTNSSEFLSLVRFYGKDKIKELYEKQKKSIKEGKE